MYFNPYALPLLAAGLLMLAVAHTVWYYRAGRWVKTFFVFICTCAVYAITYAMEISSASMDLLLFWLRIEYLAIAFIPTLFLLFALDYSGWGEKVTLRARLILFILPLLTIIIFYTNQYHGLMYQNIQFDYSGLFPVITFDRGIWYWVNSAYSSIAIFISNIIFIMMWLNAGQLYRKQIFIIILASFIPWIGLLIYLTRLIDWNIDLNAYALAVSSLLIFWGLMRHQLFILMPIARTRLFEELPDGVLVVDNYLQIIDINASAQRYLGISTDSIGKKVVEVLSSWPKLARQIQSSHKRFSVELSRYRGHKKQWLKIDFSPLYDNFSKAYGQMVIIRDITERKLSEEKLEYLATTDDLTGLSNRRHFRLVAEKEMKRARRYKHNLSMLMIDTDRFKNINDSYGHSAGDKMLEHLSALINKRVREVDLVARLGGEEFGVLLPNTDLDSALKVAEDIRESIASTPLFYDGLKIYCTVSIGLAAYRSDYLKVDHLLKAVDEALYRAKNKGRNNTSR